MAIFNKIITQVAFVSREEIMVKVDKDLLLIIMKYVKRTHSLISELGKNKIAHDNRARIEHNY